MTEFRKSSTCADGQCVEVAFRTSSFSSTGNCVEVAIDSAEGVELRDTCDRRVFYTLDEWAAFVAGVKAGEFDV